VAIASGFGVPAIISEYTTFSRTLRCGNSAKLWNTIPKRRLCAGWTVMSRFPKVILPPEGCSNPAIIRRSVVLPHPEGPRSAVSSPSAKSRSVLSTARTLPKSL
jgi:hypothetical protein